MPDRGEYVLELYKNDVVDQHMKQFVTLLGVRLFVERSLVPLVDSIHCRQGSVPGESADVHCLGFVCARSFGLAPDTGDHR